jgi:hypothetical protein
MLQVVADLENTHLISEILDDRRQKFSDHDEMVAFVNGKI